MCLFASIVKRKKKQKRKAQITKIKNMILKRFRTGWQERFENKLQTLFDLFPAIELESVDRVHGLLRVKIKALDTKVQYVVDCVTYKIERESATACESCGLYGVRRDDLFEEKMCLCWKCHALELSQLASSNETTNLY